MQIFNPFLPSWEYIPDGEPRVFGDRVYVYGSHDRFGAPIFCVNDYVCWSAPLSDLSRWTCSGVIWRKNQDPMNPLGLRLLFAPDVVRGKDGRYYLYYAFDFLGAIGVAVCDTPDGHYRFYGHVHYPDGVIWGRRKGDEFPFDPGVLVDDDGRVFLYSGFETPVPAVMSRFRGHKNSGGVVLELEPDMVTVKAGPKLLFPLKTNRETPPLEDFRGHEFFEASSIRKIDGKYVFVYSSTNNHELCWAVSDRPDGDFRFGGTLVDQGDLYLDGRTEESRGLNYLGNTHGGMVLLNGAWYIFYHRQTNQHSYSRQACAEKLERTPEGGFRQAEVTSCGLNGGPLRGEGKYSAHIACNLWSREGVARYDRKFDKKLHPFLTQTGKDREEAGDQYIANLRDGSVAGFKYFDLKAPGKIAVEISGGAEGRLEVSLTPGFERILASLPVRSESGQGVSRTEAALPPVSGKQALYFRFSGQGALNFHAFELIRPE